MMSSQARWHLKGDAPRIYDEYIAPAVSSPWYPLFFEMGFPKTSPKPNVVLDIGCGTGALLLYLLNQESIPESVKFIGVDPNPGMLILAEKKSCSLKKHARISWIKENAENLSLANNYCNLVYCQQGIQYINNKHLALAEIYRVMAPQGRFIATTWSKIEECIGYKCLADAVLNVLGDSAHTALYAPFSYSQPTDFALSVKKAGFETVNVTVVDNFVCFPSIKDFVYRRIYGSPLVENISTERSEEVINEIVTQLELMLKKYENEDGLKFPVKVNLLTAQK